MGNASVKQAGLVENGARTLFVDDGDITAMQGVERVIHPAEECDANPLVVGDQPWENRLICGGTVRKEGDLYRMWYQSFVSAKKALLNLYAESQDGIHWHKPVLSQYEDFDGNVDNNIWLSRLAFRSDNRRPVLGAQQDHNPNVLHTPHLGEERTYILISYDYGRSGYSAYDGYFLAFSRDGLHWTDGPEEPVIPGHADVGWFTFDESDQIFRGIVKNFLNIRGYRRRSVFWTESADGFDWPMPRPALIPDLEDEVWAEGRKGHYTQFYGMPIFRYESMLLGFLQVFKCTDGGTSTDGTIDVQLTCSRDGRHWQRVGDRRPIVERGEEGAWDWGMVETGNALICDGEVIRIYFTGDDSRHGAKSDARKSAIGLATWQRDRFVGLRAGSAGGEVKVACAVQGSELHVNASAASGSLTVELVTEDGQPIEGFEASQCLPLSEDTLDAAIRWRDDPSLAQLQGKPVTISITLTNAGIFSLWWA